MSQNKISLLNVHCAGEIGRVLLAGAPSIPGDSLAEKMFHINNVDDSLRRFICFEPRGDAVGSVNLLFPPTENRRDYGFIVLQRDQAHAMSGSNSICVITALLETGLVNRITPRTAVRLQTAAGAVNAVADIQDDKCCSVTLTMPAAFVERIAAPINTREWGEVSVDLCFGGVFYALVDCEQLQLTIAPKSAKTLIEAGMRLGKYVAAQYQLQHPEIPQLTGLGYVMFYQQLTLSRFRTATIMAPGRIDRSPCGTGSSALLAARYARGKIKPDQAIMMQSIIDSEFTAKIAAVNRNRIVPQITGRAWIYGRQELWLDSQLPFPHGFNLLEN